MKKLASKAKALHGGQGGFTLIEMMVVLAILGIIVGLVVPNMFGAIGEAEATQIQGQHEKMREAVFSYYADTSEYPTEWSANDVNHEDQHQLWTNADESGGDVNGWDGPYLDRPVLQDNRWSGNWGVWESPDLVTGFNVVLRYNDVPEEVCEEVDAAMDDGEYDGGSVKYESLVGVDPDKNVLEIGIARY